MTASRRPPGGDGNHMLTERQQQVLDCIRQSVEGRGYSPTMREIASTVGLKSTSAVSHQLKALATMGYVTRDARTSRTVVAKPFRLRVTQERPAEPSRGPAIASSRNLATVPLFEEIAAGPGVIANPYSEGFMRLPREMVGAGELFAVRVTGDSMINASIFDGDYVIVRQQDDAVKGDIVAALIGEIGEDVTVKTFQRVDGHVWLIPQNPSYEPIPGDGCRVMGKVVATVHSV